MWRALKEEGKMSSTMNTVINVATHLKSSLSKNAQVLIDPLDETFQTSMKRWSDEGVKTPAAILKPGCEEDILTIVSSPKCPIGEESMLMKSQVEVALQNQIPFVPKSGGNSPWSSIGSEGWVIDLSLLTDIKVDVSNQTVTLQAGVQSKPLNVAVANAGFAIQSPSGSRVGYIPFMLGGGSTYLAGMYGMAADSLVSARVVTATKGLVIASEEENSDLFWALKGAGQFFGLVTEVTMKIYRLEHPITSWTCIFLPTQIQEVADVLDEVVNGCDALSPGMCAVLAPPGQNKVRRHKTIPRKQS